MSNRIKSIKESLIRASLNAQSYIRNIQRNVDQRYCFYEETPHSSGTSKRYLEKWKYETTNYETIEKLFEWHFDVFGLIEKGLAIDINTL